MTGRSPSGSGRDASGAGLLPGTVIAVNRTLLDGSVDARNEGTMLGVNRTGIAFTDRLLEAVEVGLDRRGQPSVFDALALGADDSLFL